MQHINELAYTPIPFSVIEKQLFTKMEDKFADFDLSITTLEKKRRELEESLTVPKAEH
jgi:hypothetical protein